MPGPLRVRVRERRSSALRALTVFWAEVHPSGWNWSRMRSQPAPLWTSAELGCGNFFACYFRQIIVLHTHMFCFLERNETQNRGRGSLASPLESRHEIKRRKKVVSRGQWPWPLRKAPLQGPRRCSRGRPSTRSRLVSASSGKRGSLRYIACIRGSRTPPLTEDSGTSGVLQTAARPLSNQISFG